jgi:hypothetical protein
VQLIIARLRVTPEFPAFAGEDDFELRFRYFLFGVLPAFAGIGAWIGSVFSNNPRAGFCMWLGVLVGSVATFSVAWLLGPTIRELASRGAANRGVLAMFVAWVSLSALGAYAGKRSMRVVRARFQ